MQRKILQAIARFLFRFLSHVEVIGLENVPPQGGLILAANHLGRLDAPLVFAVVERDDVTALVADKYIHNPFFNWMVNGVHGIWINRETADFRALPAPTAPCKRSSTPPRAASRAGCACPSPAPRSAPEGLPAGAHAHALPGGSSAVAASPRIISAPAPAPSPAAPRRGAARQPAGGERQRAGGARSPVTSRRVVMPTPPAPRCRARGRRAAPGPPGSGSRRTL